MLERGAIDSGVHNSETATAGRADFHECEILEFPDQARANLVFVEPRIPMPRASPYLSLAVAQARRRANGENRDVTWPLLADLRRT